MTFAVGLLFLITLLAILSAFGVVLKFQKPLFLPYLFVVGASFLIIRLMGKSPIGLLASPGGLLLLVLLFWAEAALVLVIAKIWHYLFSSRQS